MQILVINVSSTFIALLTINVKEFFRKDIDVALKSTISWCWLCGSELSKTSFTYDTPNRASISKTITALIFVFVDYGSIVSCKLVWV